MKQTNFLKDRNDKTHSRRNNLNGLISIYQILDIRFEKIKLNRKKTPDSDGFIDKLY